MKWATAISRKAVFEDAVIECVAGVREALGSGPVTLLGCSAGGVIGGGEEVERLPAVTLTASRLPDVVVRPFHLDGGALPDLDGPPDSWERLVGAERSQEPQFVLLADPFTSHPEALLAGPERPLPRRRGPHLRHRGRRPQR